MKDGAKDRREDVSRSAREKKGWVCTQVMDTDSNTDWQGTLWRHWCSVENAFVDVCVCVWMNTASKATESIDTQHHWVSSVCLDPPWYHFIDFYCDPESCWMWDLIVLSVLHAPVGGDLFFLASQLQRINFFVNQDCTSSTHTSKTTLILRQTMTVCCCTLCHHCFVIFLPLLLLWLYGKWHWVLHSRETVSS